MSYKSRYLVLLPAYNEEECIGEVISDIVACLSDGEGRVLVVDDGSSDSTSAIVREFPPEKVVLVRHAVNRGLAKALDTGFRQAYRMLPSFDALITMDADGTHPAAIIPSMLRKVDEGAGLVVASRYVQGGRQLNVPWFRRTLSRAVNLALQIRFLLPVRDCTSGFRCYSAETLRGMVTDVQRDLLCSAGFEASSELLLLARKAAKSVCEVPLVLDYGPRIGKSKMKVSRTIQSYVRLLVAGPSQRENT